MKRFLAAFAAWLAVLLLGGFFLAGWLFERGYWIRPVAALALLLAGFSCVVYELASEQEALKKRLEALEKARAADQTPDQEG